MEPDGWVDDGHPDGAFGLQVDLLAGEFELLHLLPIDMDLHPQKVP